MSDDRAKIWPYSNRAALLAAPLIWCAIGVALFVIQSYSNLSTQTFLRVVLFGLAIGLIPLLLSLIDYVALNRAVIDVKGVRLDFSQTELTRRTVELPDNIGKPEPLISDSSPMEIVSTLEFATAHEVVRLDIREGEAWWVTRLFALGAGAVRVGSPKALVFVGIKQSTDGAFLGWAPPSALLRALMADNQPRGVPPTTYGAIYQKAIWITQQVAVFGKPDEPPAAQFIPPDPPMPQLPSDVQRYFQPHRRKYVQLGEAALEQILMDQLGLYQLENPPDRLTLGRLEELFAHCLYRGTVDLQASKELQLSAFLDSSTPYVALVRGARYEGLVERREVDRLLLRQLFMRPELKR